MLGCGPLYVKRDDLIGYSWGGNKIRTIEFLLGAALQQRADAVVLCGGVTSNFAALMAAACAQHGLALHQVSYGNAPRRVPAAMSVGVRCGTTYHFTASEDRSSTEAMAETIAARLLREGQRPYLLPRGGATPVGALGYAHAATELAEQLRSLGLRTATVVLPVGSGGTLAGLVVGWSQGEGATTEIQIELVGVSVSRPAQEMSATVHRIATACPLRSRTPSSSMCWRIVDGRGAGFGEVDSTDRQLIHQIERETCFLVDATYNAKALRWMRESASGLRGNVVYWHTGGIFGVVDRLLEADAFTSPHSSIQ